MNRSLAISFLACVLYAFSASAQEIKRDIVYGKAGDVELKLDLAEPTAGGGPFPAIVCLHGGAWQGGNRKELDSILPLLARNGYVAASVEYRLTPKYKWPAQIEDSKCAVRFLRAKSKEYRIDPNHVGAVGMSAGGHLALLLGLLDPKDGFEGHGGNLNQSSKVQAVVNYFGPTDFPLWHPMPIAELFLRQAYGGRDSNALLVDLFGTSDRKAAILAKASPITYINAGDPPILTFHGALDPLVPVAQAHLLHDALKKAKVPEELVIIPLGLHGWAGAELNRTEQLTIDFFNKELKHTDRQHAETRPTAAN